MKYTITIFFTVLFFGSCSEKPKDYATISGKISNPNKLNQIIISNIAGYSKQIKVKKDGSFSDTLKIEEVVYRFYDGIEMGSIFLKNNNKTSFTLDTKNFDETLKFKGDDADKSNFIVANNLLQEKYLTDEIFNSSKNEFIETFDNLENAYQNLKN